MRRIALFATILIAILLPVAAQAQPSEDARPKEPSTKLESFLAQKGTLIVKDFYPLGEVNGRYNAKMKFDALVIYQPGQETQRLRGLRVEVTESGSYDRSHTSFLDIDEIESLSKAMAYMLDLIEKWKEVSKPYTEVIFATKGDFEAGFYQEGTKPSAFSSSGYVGKTSCYLNSAQGLSSIKAIADSAMSVLSGK
jgi:hypothetical protein